MKRPWIVFLLIFILLSGICVILHLNNDVDQEIEEELYSVKYSEYVEKYSEEYGVDCEIIYAVIKCESNFDPEAVSSVGAMGLMQMMPATFKDVQLRIGEELDDSALLDPETAIKYGTYYLAYLYRYFGDWELVFAAYNAGMGNVSKWLENKEYSDGGKLTHIPYAETERYVNKVIAARDEYTKLLTEVK